MLKARFIQYSRYVTFTNTDIIFQENEQYVTKLYELFTQARLYFSSQVQLVRYLHKGFSTCKFMCQ